MLLILLMMIAPPVIGVECWRPAEATTRTNRLHIFIDGRAKLDPSASLWLAVRNVEWVGRYRVPRRVGNEGNCIQLG
jgi:hypothetical protein